MGADATSVTGGLIDELRRLVLEVQDHPEVRLPLLDEVRGRLRAVAANPLPDWALAERLERWRYQILNHFAGQMSSDLENLALGLDRLRLDLIGRPDLPTRRCRFLPASLCAAASGFARRSLGPAMELDGIEHAARVATHALGAQTPVCRGLLLYAPLYLSSYCINSCTYCGYRYPHAIERLQLTPAQARDEAEVLWERGIRHVLVVAGEFPAKVTTAYLCDVIRALHERGFSVAVEVAPQSTLGYRRLHEAGATGVTLYQETYDRVLYATYHRRGTKALFDGRLEGPERAAEAGITRLGLGILLGLADPEADLGCLIAHGMYLRNRFPQVCLAFSLPRIFEAPPGFEPLVRVDDDTFIRMYCCLRAAFPEADLVLSTRESAPLRDRLAAICITQLSAGSSTSPGGYTRTEASDSCESRQFPVCDERSARDLAGRLASMGLAVRWELDGAAPPG